jgi:hypothetical protein
MHCGEYKLLMCNFLRHAVSSALDPDILNVYSYLTVRDQISRPGKTTGKFNDLYISALNILKHTFSVFSVMM